MYLLDSNIYIQSKNLHYNMNFCPAFWDWLEQERKNNRVMSIYNVYLELTDSKDELSAWAKENKHHFIDISDTATQIKFAEISNFVMSQENKDSTEKDNFLGKADPWLVAKASTIGATLVTYEKHVPEDSKKIKIPNICKEFNVAYISIYQLLLSLEAKFVLTTKAVK